MYYAGPPYPCPVCHNYNFDVAPNVINASTVQFIHPDLPKRAFRFIKRQFIKRQPIYDTTPGNVHEIDGYICKVCGFTSLYSRAVLDSIYSPEE